MPKIAPKTTRFAAADYLDSAQRQTAYIARRLNPATRISCATRSASWPARGMGEIAKSAGLNRESLYKALGETGNPEFSTVMRVLRAMGLSLSARPVVAPRTRKKRRVA